MAAILWDRREEASKAYKLIPSVSSGSKRDFRPPKTLESDFTRLQQHEVPHINYTYEIIRNWYETIQMTPEEIENPDVEYLVERYRYGTRHIRVENDSGEVTYYLLNDDGTFEVDAEYAPIMIRAQQTPIDWKSKIGNSDMSSNFKTDYSVEIGKGDIAVREDGKIYVLNWTVTNHANNQATQCCECNYMTKFTRMLPDTVDERGMVVTPSHEVTVAPEIPIVHVEYAGRPDYVESTNIAGLHPDHLITVTLQWNPTTKNIRVNDEFVIGDYAYRAVNVSLVEVNLDQTRGMLTIHAKRVAGGVVEWE